MPLGERPDEAALEVALRLRARERERGEELQRERGIALGALMEGVQQRVRLAQAERRGDDEARAAALDDALRAALGAVMLVRHCHVELKHRDANPVSLPAARLR